MPYLPHQPIITEGVEFTEYTESATIITEADEFTEYTEISNQTGFSVNSVHFVPFRANETRRRVDPKTRDVFEFSVDSVNSVPFRDFGYGVRAVAARTRTRVEVVIGYALGKETVGF